MKTNYNLRAWDMISHTPYVKLYSLGVLLESGAKIVIPVLMGCFIDAIIRHATIWKIAVTMVGAALLVVLLHRELQVMIHRLSRTVELELKQTLLARFRTMRPMAVDDYRQGEIALKFFRDAANIGVMMRELFPHLLYGTFNIVLTFAAVVWKITLSPSPHSCSCRLSHGGCIRIKNSLSGFRKTPAECTIFP